MNNPDFVLHIETSAREDRQETLVKVEGAISGIGQIVVLEKVLETLDMPDYMVALAVKLWKHRDEIPETRININGLRTNDD